MLCPVSYEKSCSVGTGTAPAHWKGSIPKIMNTEGCSPSSFHWGCQQQQKMGFYSLWLSFGQRWGFRLVVSSSSANTPKRWRCRQHTECVPNSLFYTPSLGVSDSVVCNEEQQFVCGFCCCHTRPPKMRSYPCSCRGTESQGAAMGQQPQKPLSHRYCHVLASDIPESLALKKGFGHNGGKRKRKIKKIKKKI